MNIDDEIRDLAKKIADINLRLNKIRSASAGAHNLLSSTHGDTDPASPVAGDVIFGDATPKWARRAKGADGDVLTLVGGFPDWDTPAAGVTEDDVAFWDKFVGTSLDWMWTAFGTAAGKALTYPGGKVRFADTSNTKSFNGDGTQFGIRTFCGAHEAHEYTVKISSVALGKNSAVILSVEQEPYLPNNPDHGVQLFYYNDDGSGTNKFYFTNPNSSGYSSGTSTAATIYLKIRMLGGAIHNQFTAFWSEDGTAWTPMTNGGNPIVFTNLYAANYPFKAAITGDNWNDGGTYHSFSFDLEWFKMTRPRGIRA